MAETIPALVWITAEDGHSIYANERWRTYTGVNITDVPSGQVAARLFHPDDAERVLTEWRSRREGDDFETTYRLRRHDGTYRWHLARVVRYNERFWLGAAVDIHDRKVSTNRFESLMEALPQIVFTLDRNRKVTYYNERWLQYTGLSRDAAMAQEWSSVAHPDDAPEAQDVRLRRRDGAYRWHRIRTIPLHDESGEPSEWIVTANDIHDSMIREQNLAFLNEVSELLSSSLQLDTTLVDVAKLAASRIADWCWIYLLKDEDAVPMAVAHRNEIKLQLARELTRQYPRQVYGDISGEAMLGNRSLLLPQIPEEHFRTTAKDERHLLLLKSLQLRSAMIVPLRLRDEPLGFMEFANGPHTHPFDAVDLQLAEVLAKRISVAVDNARLFDRERRVAHTFQQAALPRALPRVKGLQLSAVYEAAGTNAEVGGDWYDAFLRHDGSLVLSIGDVAGKGLDAAVHMAHMRQAIRVTALQRLEPHEVLRIADEALQLEYPGQIASAIVAVVSPDHRTLSWSNAGHPPAFLRSADRTVHFLEQISAPLGIVTDGNFETRTVALPQDAVLCLYTDGLIESERDVLTALEQLMKVAGDDALGHVSNHARFIRDAMLQQRPRDDVAIVAVGLAHNRHWTFDANDAMRAQSARSSFVAYLRAHGLPNDDYDAAEVIFGELTGNVVRYAPGPIDIDLEWIDNQAVLHVIDHGPGFELRAQLPEDELSEHGRGLFIISALGRDFRSKPLAGGGSHVRVVLPVTRR